MKKILGLTIAALLIIGMVGGGTWAYFSDTETSTDNTFTAGTLDLKLQDDDESATDGVTASWFNDNMAPGDSEVGWVDLWNSGTLDAHHVEISFANTVTDVVTTGNDDDISDSMNVTAMSYGATDLLALSAGAFVNTDIEAADVNDDQIITLDELDSVTIDNLTEVPTADSALEKRLAMTVELDSDTGNGNQGDSVTTVITFELNQDASQ